MCPASAVSGYYFSHPKSQYFVVGRLSREQVADYAQRKGVPLAQAERWLAPNLDYDPETEDSPDQVVGHLVLRIGVRVVAAGAFGSTFSATAGAKIAFACASTAAVTSR